MQAEDWNMTRTVSKVVRKSYVSVVGKSWRVTEACSTRTVNNEDKHLKG